MTRMSPIEALEVHRVSRGLTKKDFAAQLWLNPGNYCDILNGRRGMGLSVIKRAYALGIPADVLLQINPPSIPVSRKPAGRTL